MHQPGAATSVDGVEPRLVQNTVSIILIKHCWCAAVCLSNVVKTLLKFQTLSKIQSGSLRHSDQPISVKCGFIWLMIFLVYTRINVDILIQVRFFDEEC